MKSEIIFYSKLMLWASFPLQNNAIRQKKVREELLKEESKMAIRKMAEEKKKEAEDRKKLGGGHLFAIISEKFCLISLI